MSLMGSLGTKWPIASPDELHLSLTRSLSCFICSPLRGLLQFAADPGVRWKTYTHKQYLLFMPYSPVIHSQQAQTTTAVQLLQALTDRSSRPRNMAPLNQLQLSLVTYCDQHICVTFVCKRRRHLPFALLTWSTFFKKLTLLASHGCGLFLIVALFIIN